VSFAYLESSLAASDVRGLVSEIKIGLIELPFRDRFNVDFDSRTKRVNLFREVEIDDRAVVETDSPGKGIQADLQAAVEVSPVGRLKKIHELDTEERTRQRLFSCRRELATGSLRRDQLGDVTIERFRWHAEHPAPANTDVLMIDSGW
jgi:hypothetical protein